MLATSPAMPVEPGHGVRVRRPGPALASSGCAEKWIASDQPW